MSLPSGAGGHFYLLTPFQFSFLPSPLLANLRTIIPFVSWPYLAWQFYILGGKAVMPCLLENIKTKSIVFMKEVPCET